MNWPLIISNTIFTAISIQAIGFILAAIGINVHFGFTGLLNFGQAAFAAVGAYTFAVSVREFDAPVWLAFLLIFPLAAALALLLGAPTLRLRADYLAIVTIAAAEILRLFLQTPRWTPTLGGQDGLQTFTAGVDGINPFSGNRYSLWRQPFDGHVLFVMIVGWGLVIVVSLVVWALMRSPWGRVLKSIREDEDAAKSLGKNIFAYKMQALVLGGVIGALGGMILAVGGRAAAPGDYSTQQTFLAWTIVILGGAGRIKGPIVGGLIFWFIIGFSDVFLSQATATGLIPSWLISPNEVGLFRFAIVGLGLALLVIFRPHGIFGDKREQAFDVR